MALDPAGGHLQNTTRNVDGTCATTITVFYVHFDEILICADTNDVRFHVYGADETTPATGASASGVKYTELDSTESVVVRNPRPGALPWAIGIWGAAGGEAITMLASG